MARTAVAEDFGMVVVLPRSESKMLSVMARMLQMQITTRAREDRVEKERIRLTYSRRAFGIRTKKIHARRRRG